MAMVTKSIKEPGVYSSGAPVMPNKDWHKSNARVNKLDRIFSRVKALETELAHLQTQLSQEKES
jgi:UDP-3-O-[3-hydroxymyristoyl] glucosamine N-acyltransferase